MAAAKVTRSSGDTAYRTANLTLASFLAHSDMPYRLVRGEGRLVTWEFNGSQVAGLVARFEKGEAKVEPQSFHHSITKTRRMLFDFINSGDAVWEPDKIAHHNPAAPGRES